MSSLYKGQQPAVTSWAARCDLDRAFHGTRPGHIHARGQRSQRPTPGRVPRRAQVQLRRPSDGAQPGGGERHSAQAGGSSLGAAKAARSAPLADRTSSNSARAAPTTMDTLSCMGGSAEPITKKNVVGLIPPGILRSMDDRASCPGSVRNRMERWRRRL